MHVPDFTGILFQCVSYVYNRITPRPKNRAWCYPSFYPALPISLLHPANGKSCNEIPLQKGIQTDDREHS